MAQNADHSKKLDEATERQNKYLARRVEEQDTDRKGGSTTPIPAEEHDDQTSEFAVDYMCTECSPSDYGHDELVTSAVSPGPQL